MKPPAKSPGVLGLIIPFVLLVPLVWLLVGANWRAALAGDAKETEWPEQMIALANFGLRPPYELVLVDGTPTGALMEPTPARDFQGVRSSAGHWRVVDKDGIAVLGPALGEDFLGCTMNSSGTLVLVNGSTNSLLFPETKERRTLPILFPHHHGEPIWRWLDDRSLVMSASFSDYVRQSSDHPRTWLYRYDIDRREFVELPFPPDLDPDVSLAVDSVRAGQYLHLREEKGGGGGRDLGWWQIRPRVLALPAAPAIVPDKDDGSIGSATIDDEGTITIRLRAEVAGGMGDGLLTYHKGDPLYASILKHLGPLHPGQTVSVKPWTESATSK